MADYIPDDLLFYNEFEPKTKNRFYVVINGIPSFMIKNVGLPKLSFNKNTIDHINLKRPVLGKGE